jgi:mannose-6-phosphate isomerase-like protein (cupin superfamily)
MATMAENDTKPTGGSTSGVTRLPMVTDGTRNNTHRPSGLGYFLAMAEPQVVMEGEVEPRSWSDPVRGTFSFSTLTGGERPAPGLSAGIAVMEPGGWIGLHRHEPAETYYVLEGRGVLTLDKQDLRLEPGSVVYIPGDREHAVRNDGEGRLRVFYVFSAARFDDVEYRFTDEV